MVELTLVAYSPFLPLRLRLLACQEYLAALAAHLSLRKAEQKRHYIPFRPLHVIQWVAFRLPFGMSCGIAFVFCYTNTLRDAIQS